MTNEQRKSIAMEYLANYDKARDAHNAYLDALKAEFGPSASPWNAFRTDYGDAVERAYQGKIKACETWIASLKVMRANNVSINAPEISEALKLETLDRR